MNLQSLIEMVKCRLREFYREPSALIFVVLMPIMWMLILGFSLSSGEISKINIGIANSLESHKLPVKQILLKSELLKVLSSEEKDLASKLSKKRISLYITLDKGKKDLVFKLNSNDKESFAAKSIVNDLIQEELGRKDPRPPIIDILPASRSRYIDFLIPGLLALSLFTTSLFGTGMTIVSARRENLLKRYAVTPQSPYAFFLSHIIGRYLIFALELFTVFVAGFLIFDFSIKGPFLAFISASLLGVAAFTAIALLLSSRSRNTGAYNGCVNLVTLCLMIPAGIWFPKHYFPSWFENFAAFLPLTALVDALRKVAIDGIGFTGIYNQLFILIVYLAAGSFLAKKYFKLY